MDLQEIKVSLEEKLQTLESRMGKIRRDRQREDGPLDADSEEQAVELENAPVLDALNEAGWSELQEIRGALARIDAGRFGTCEACGEAITTERLHALPTATRCLSCAE